MNLDWVTLVLGAILGAALGALVSQWLTLFSHRPLLSVTGGGGGGPEAGLISCNASISNRPGLFGLKLGETTIFGVRLHSRIELGLILDRSPARNAWANIVDQSTGEQIPLWWRSPGDPNKFERHLTIHLGDTAPLMLFSKYPDTKSHFIFSPSHRNSEIHTPTRAHQIDGDRKYSVEVKCENSRKTLHFEASVKRSYDGTLYYQSAGGGGSF